MNRSDSCSRRGGQGCAKLAHGATILWERMTDGMALRSIGKASRDNHKAHPVSRTAFVRAVALRSPYPGADRNQPMPNRWCRATCGAPPSSERLDLKYTCRAALDYFG